MGLEEGVFGFNQALYNIAMISRELEIISKHENTVNYKIVKQGEQEVKRLLLGKGTTVSCRGVFHSTPMRQAVDESDIKKEFIRYALINPQVAISYQSEHLKFSLERTKSSLHSFERIYGTQATEIPEFVRGDFKISGFHYQMDKQFVYVNKIPTTLLMKFCRKLLFGFVLDLRVPEYFIDRNGEMMFQHLIAEALGSSDAKEAHDVKLEQRNNLSRPVLISSNARPLLIEKSIGSWVNLVKLVKQTIPKPKHSFEINLDSEQLNSLRVVGQVDRKFIACETNGLILVLDQHAVDERIKLEQYLHQFKTQIKPLQYGFRFNAYYQELIKQYSKKLLGIGITMKNAGFAVTRDYRTNDIRILVNLIQESLEYFDKVGLNLIPNPVVDHFKSKACRSAIMFGAKLSNNECEKLLGELLQCKVN
ncbi:DNA mismatch repair protein [Terramyces sp. JEL0728]|nr:DNA mismatch repair protein [Terramyces sp. JEL0728]